MISLDEINIKEQLKNFNVSIENIDENEAKQFIQERLNISYDIDKLIKKYGEDKIVIIIQNLLDRLDTIFKIKNEYIKTFYNITTKNDIELTPEEDLILEKYEDNLESQV